MDESSNYIRIGSGIDRFQEAHFWIHMMEDSYHLADPFRWYLNVFLKALNEVPQIVQMELQNAGGFPTWFRAEKKRLAEDPLISHFSTSRNMVVHKRMLVPKSHASLGVTEGEGMKLGLTFPLRPLEDSDDAMERYLSAAAKGQDFLGIMIPDDDSMPCVYRRWALEEFESELVDLCAQAWLRTGKLLDAVLIWLGEEEVPPLSMDCRHASQKIRYRLYDRERLIEQFKAIKATIR